MKDFSIFATFQAGVDLREGQLVWLKSQTGTVYPIRTSILFKTIRKLGRKLKVGWLANLGWKPVVGMVFKKAGKGQLVKVVKYGGSSWGK